MSEALIRSGGHQLIQQPQRQLGIAEIQARLRMVQSVMSSVMQEGIHYGTIPGTSGKALLQPGAELLGMTFMLAANFEMVIEDLGGEHRNYQATCMLTNNGDFVACGVGSCSTKESKYRYRYDDTGAMVPSEYWDNRDQTLLGPSCVAKKQGKDWKIMRQVEHADPADYYNTCLKMACKRAHVAAIRTALAASDAFDRDTESLGAIDREQITKIIDAFARMGINVKELEEYVGMDIDVIGQAEQALLTAYYAEVKRGGGKKERAENGKTATDAAVESLKGDLAAKGRKSPPRANTKATEALTENPANDNTAIVQDLLTWAQANAAGKSEESIKMFLETLWSAADLAGTFSFATLTAEQVQALKNQHVKLVKELE